MNALEKNAAAFAAHAHESIGQRRKYSDEPYIVHPAAVAAIVRSVPHDEAMLAAAWLHDTVEDTGVTLDEIERAFGSDVAQLVEMLTDVSKPEQGNRRLRKEIDRVHTAKASPRAKTVKLADLIHNSDSILKHGPGFAVKFIREMEALLAVLGEGDRTLLAQARAIVDGSAGSRSRRSRHGRSDSGGGSDRSSKHGTDRTNVRRPE